MLVPGNRGTSTRRSSDRTFIAPQSSAQKRAQSPACGERPWWTWTATMSSARPCAQASVASSSATESRPPDSPMASVEPFGTCAVRARPTAAVTRAAPSCRPPTGGATASAGDHLLELAIAEDLVLARLEKRIERLLLNIAQRLDESLLERHHHRRMVPMRTPERLVDDLVDEPELLQARSRDAQRLRRLGRMVGRLPENRRAAFGRNHRIRRVLEHQRDIADGDGERPARAAFADDGDDDRSPQAGHLVQIAADRFGLAPLLRADPRIRAGRVDEAEQRETELLGELHQPQRLSIAFGTRHAEIAVDLFLGVAAFLMADHHARFSVETRESAHDCRVVRVRAITVELAEIGKQCADVIERVRPLWMTRHLRDLPGRQLGVDLLRQKLALFREPGDLVRNIDGGILVHVAKLVDLLL